MLEKFKLRFFFWVILGEDETSYLLTTVYAKCHDLRTGENSAKFESVSAVGSPALNTEDKVDSMVREEVYRT